MAGSILDEIDAALGDEIAPPQPRSILDEIDMALSEPDAPPVDQWQSDGAMPVSSPDGMVLNDVGPGEIDPTTVKAPIRSTYDPNPDVSGAAGIAQSAASGIVGGVLDLANQVTRVNAAINPLSAAQNILMGRPPRERYTGFEEASKELAEAQQANFPNRDWAEAAAGAGKSLGKNVPLALSGAGLAGMVASQFEESTVQAMGKADAAGLKGLDKARYVLTEAGTEAALTVLFSKIPGMGGAEGALAQLGNTKAIISKSIAESAKSLGKTIGAEELEELSIYALQAVNEKYSGVNAAALNPDEFLDGAKKVARSTVMMAGAAGSAQVFVEKHREHAHILAAKEALSRKDAEEIGIEGKNNVPNRKALHEQLKATFNALPVDLPPQPRNDRRASLEEGMQGPPAETPAPPEPVKEPTPVERVHAMVKEDGTPPVKDEVVKALGVTREEASALIKQAFPPAVETLQEAPPSKPNFFNAVNLNKNTLPLPDQTPKLEKVSFNEPAKPAELPLPEDKALPLLKPGQVDPRSLSRRELALKAKELGIKQTAMMSSDKLIAAIDAVQAKDRRSVGRPKNSLLDAFESDQQGRLKKRLGGDRTVSIANPHYVTGLTYGAEANEFITRQAVKEYDPNVPIVYAEGDFHNLGGLNDAAGGQTAANKHLKAITDIVLKYIPKDADAALTYKGSDEYGWTFRGVPKEQVEQILASAEPEVVSYAESVGIDKIPHPKGKAPGVGLNWAIQQFDPAVHKPGKYTDKKGNDLDLDAAGAWVFFADKQLEVNKKLKGIDNVDGGPKKSPSADSKEVRRDVQAPGQKGTDGRRDAPGLHGRGSGSGSSQEAATEVQPQPKTEVAEDLRKQADEVSRAEPLGSLGGNVIGDEVVLRNNESTTVRPAPRPEFEKALRGAKGAKKQSTWEHLKQVVDSAWRKSTRAQGFIPNTPENAVANDALRRLKDVPNIASDDVVRNIAAATFKMETPQYELFSRYLVIKNLQEALSRAEPGRFTASDKAEVDQYAADLEKDVNANKVVKEAVENRQRLVKEFVTTLQENGLLPDDMDREWYYHQQVLSKLKEQRIGGGMKPKIIKRSFQKGRIKADGLTLLAEEYDYNTEYIEAEVAWMTEAKMELLKKGILKEITNKYDEAPRLEKLREDPDVKVELPNHSWWSPGPGNMFYSTLSPEEKAAEALQDNILAESGLSEEDKQAANAIAGRNRFLLPDHIVAQLQKMEKTKPSDPLPQFFKDMTSGWKGWMLGAPHKIIPAQARNALGDLDSTFAGAPGILKAALGVTGEVWDYYSGKKLTMSADMTKARDLGVLQSSMVVQEIPDAKDLPLFRRFYGQSNLLVKTTQGYIEKTKQYASFREATLRYAAFKYFRDQLNAGTLKYYGASNEATVKALAKDAGVDKAAAKLARELVGDYGNLTEAGTWVRDHLIPFWSYQEINAKRYSRFLANIVKGKGSVRETAIVGTAAAMRLGAAYAMFTAINHLFFRDEEEKLSRFDKQNPHLILGTYPDGSIKVLRNVGAVGDALEWLGLNTLASLYPQWRDGQVGTEHLLKEMAKDLPNKLAQGIHPAAKGGIEIVSGQSYFPDAFNPRSVDRDVAAADVIGMGDYYKALKGFVLKDGSRARPHTLDRALVGVSDPNQNALSEIYDLREKFEKKTDGGGGRRGDPNFKNMRLAAGANDYKAFKEAKALYVASGKKIKNFKDSLENLDPIASMKNAEERRFAQEFLNDSQRLKLKIARDYAANLEMSLRAFWWRSEDEK